MPKHNQFIKKLKSQFVSINDTRERYFNNLKFFITDSQKRKLSPNNKENLDNLSAASQLGFLANCNEEISDSFLDGLNFDSYPIYSSY